MGSAVSQPLAKSVAWKTTLKLDKGYDEVEGLKNPVRSTRTQKPVYEDPPTNSQDDDDSDDDMKDDEAETVEQNEKAPRAQVKIRVSIRQHTAAYVCIPQNEQAPRAQVKILKGWQ
jgi:hypothetical protein